MPADLHVHTTCSDSILTPREVINECLWHGIDAVAITDHDPLEGIPSAAEAGEQVGVRVIPGVELTAYDGPLELHVIGLFLNPDPPALNKVLQRSRDARRLRVFEIVHRLEKIGVELSTEEVFRIANGGAPGRPHVAKALVNRGHVATVSDAFDYYIGNGGPAYVPKYNLTTAQAAGAIHAGGGVSVIAHPGNGLPDESVRQVVRDGIDAIEVYHPVHSYEEQQKYLQMAEELGALVSGGSDSHGATFGSARIGVIKLEPQLVENLEKRALRRREQGRLTAGEVE